jgi:hypothetical protein
MRNVGRLVGSILSVAVVLISLGTSAMAAAPAESARMLKAKDLISEDQWLAAIGVLKAAVADAREPNKDEALYWLAHSQNQAGDLAESVESIRRLRREFPKSRWSPPAYSLLIELALKLGQNDVLWWAATPPLPPSVPKPPRVPPQMVQPRMPGPAGPQAVPPAPPAPPAMAVPIPPPPAGPAAATPPAPAALPPPPPPPPAWVSDAFLPDTSLQVQALSRLILTDAPKAIPRLKQIVLEHADPSAARGAVFVLAQSRNPEAYRVVVDVALTGPEPLRTVAVRDLGLFGGADVSQELLRVYSMANRPVKLQVVIALRQRSDAPSLFKIVTSETDPALRERAIVALGRAGGRDDLRVLYAKAHLETRQAIVTGLCNARDEVGLIRIADQEKDGNVRNDAVGCLRLMGTPGAKAYLSKGKETSKERK